KRRSVIDPISTPQMSAYGKLQNERALSWREVGSETEDSRINLLLNVCRISVALRRSFLERCDFSVVSMYSERALWARCFNCDPIFQLDKSVLDCHLTLVAQVACSVFFFRSSNPGRCLGEMLSGIKKTARLDGDVQGLLGQCALAIVAT